MMMYVKALEYDCWKGAVKIDKKRNHPSIEEIKNSINSIDGVECQGVILFGKEENDLAVGGGAHGKYVVYYSSANGEIFTLLSDGASEDVCTLLVGGQEGRYRGNIVVNLESVLTAVRTFTKTGKLDSKLKWLKK
jgi:hypothetical protein